MSTLPSRRVATRRDVVLPCQVIRKSDFKLVSDRTMDLSTDGLLVPVHATLPVGETVLVSFTIAGAWIDAEAVVTRIVQGRRPGDDGMALGLFFTSIESSMRSTLALFLHGKPPPLPRRGPLSRLRRGEPAPQLADEDVMAMPLAGARDLADERDVETDDEIDPGAILRALVGAWQNLRLE